MRRFRIGSPGEQGEDKRFLDRDEALRALRAATADDETLQELRRRAAAGGKAAPSDEDLLATSAAKLEAGLLSTTTTATGIGGGAASEPSSGGDAPAPEPSGGGGTVPKTDPTGPVPVTPHEDKVCPTSVTIEAACRILKVGEAKTVKAVDPDGTSSGTYKWTTTSGKGTLTNDSSATVTVTAGAAASASYEDIVLKVTRSEAGCPDVAAEVKLTVFQFDKIKVTVEPTPPNTVRAGYAPPADHVVEITSDSTDFGANTPVVLMRCKDREAALELTAAPPDLPIHWHVARNSADHATLGGSGDLPTLTPEADVTKAVLKADNKGSFNIRPFVSCTGDATFDANHAPVCLNLVLADATVQADKSAAYTPNLSVTLNVNDLRVVNGAWGPAPLSAATLAAAGCAMELVSDVTGGGADGRLGLDQVFCGLVNNVAIRNVNFLYQDTTVAPPTNHRHRLRAVSNQSDATSNVVFLSTDPAPILHALPLLDSGLTPHGEGGDTALMTRSQADPSTRVNQPVGIRFTTRCIDSPGTSGPRTHYENANAVMNGIDYQYRFVAAFCFWTNRDKARGKTDKMAERVYSVLRMFTWEIRGVWDVSWPAGSPATVTPTTPHTISISGPQTKTPLEDAEDNNVEVRPPSGVAAGLSWDAQ